MDMKELFKNIPAVIKKNAITAIAIGLSGSIKEACTLPENLIKNLKKIIDAKTDAKVKIIEAGGFSAANALSSSQELSHRALDNLGSTIIRNQKNREMIALKVFNELKLADNDKDCVKDDIDEDWLFRFWSLVEHVSKDDIQNIVSKLLTDEIVSPGTIGLNTVTTLMDLNKKNLEAFQKLCNISIAFKDTAIVIHPNILALKDTGPLDTYGITYRELLEIESLGLIRSVHTLSLAFSTDNNYKVVDYANKVIKLKLNKGFDSLFLSPTGVELRNNLVLTENIKYTNKLIEICKDEIILKS